MPPTTRTLAAGPCTRAIRRGQSEQMTESLRAVLFDMDGTLVETEEHWGVALFALAERLGGQLSPEARRATNRDGSVTVTVLQVLASGKCFVGAAA